MKHVRSLLLLSCLLTSELTAGTPTPTTTAAASNAFGWSIFAQLQDAARQNQNILFSPLSAWLALSLASNGAEKETLIEMRRVLHSDSLSLVEANRSIQDFVDHLLSPEGDSEVLSIAHSVWSNSDIFELSPSFADTAATFYAIPPEQTVARAASFDDPSTADAINGWVKQQTQGMIPELISKLRPDMAAILINALFFQGQWLEPFNPYGTRAATFTPFNGKTLSVNMMQASGGAYPFANDGRFKMLSLNFRAGVDARDIPIVGRFQLDLVIPAAAGLTALNLTQADYEGLVKRLRPLVVDVAVPKLQFEYENSLVDELQAVGLHRLFQPGVAQLAPLGTARGKLPVFVSDVLQKTAVQMDERGFKAAAATSVTASTTAMPVPQDSFIADHPFFIALRNRETGALLFQGLISAPNASK